MFSFSFFLCTHSILLTNSIHALFPLSYILLSFFFLVFFILDYALYCYIASVLPSFFAHYAVSFAFLFPILALSVAACKILFLKGYHLISISSGFTSLTLFILLHSTFLVQHGLSIYVLPFYLLQFFISFPTFRFF